MDPLRTDSRPAEAQSGADRDARIEQLLLAGLDEYFNHRYEHAINLWTRVLFFDRHHDRARAYIERARRAQAERQRETDAVLHQGLEALRAGDVARARALVADALDRGAAPDEAQDILDRIERLGAAQAAPKRWRRRAVTTVAPGGGPALAGATDTPRPSRARGWFAAVLLVVAALGVLAVGTWGLAVPELAGWPVFSFAPPPPPSAIPWRSERLPVPAASETYLTRARELSGSGRVRDALAVLDRIPVGDPLYREAARLRADLQRQLLALVALEQQPE